MQCIPDAETAPDVNKYVRSARNLSLTVMAVTSLSIASCSDALRFTTSHARHRYAEALVEDTYENTKGDLSKIPAEGIEIEGYGKALLFPDRQIKNSVNVTLLPYAGPKLLENNLKWRGTNDTRTKIHLNEMRQFATRFEIRPSNYRMQPKNEQIKSLYRDAIWEYYARDATKNARHTLLPVSLSRDLATMFYFFLGIALIATVHSRVKIAARSREASDEPWILLDVIDKNHVQLLCGSCFTLHAQPALLFHIC